MSGFRKAVTVRRPPAGAYVDGRWVEGVPSEFSILASVQPANGEDLQALPEGRRKDAVYKLYTDTVLLSASPEAKRNPDRVVLFGEEFEVRNCQPWQNNVIPHFKVIVSRENIDLGAAAS